MYPSFPAGYAMVEIGSMSKCLYPPKKTSLYIFYIYIFIFIFFVSILVLQFIFLLVPTSLVPRTFSYESCEFLRDGLEMVWDELRKAWLVGKFPLNGNMFISINIHIYIYIYVF